MNPADTVFPRLAHWSTPFRVVLLVTLINLCGALFGAAQAAASVSAARKALDGVASAMSLVQHRDIAGARRVLTEVEAFVAAQEQAVIAFNDQAKNALARCTASVDELDHMLGEIAGTEETVTRDLQSTERALESALNDRTVTDAEARALDAQIAKVLRSISARQAKLKELEKYWWVPFYGAYLGIRTLADKDITEMAGLQRDLREKQIEGGGARRRLQAAQHSAQRLSAERSRLQAERETTLLLHDDLRARMARVREATVFIADAKLFWAQLNNFIKFRVSGAVEDVALEMTLLSDELLKPGGKVESVWVDSEATNLREKLLRIAEMLENGQGYAVLSATDCKVNGSRGALSPRADGCNFTPKYPYYEMVDVATCSFRYVNPPGCPPAVARPSTYGIRLANVTNILQTARGKSATDQNWIGLARCSSKEAIYLGRISTASLCEAACLANPDCRFWTYNNNNGMISGSASECWGGTRYLIPADHYTRKWGGFVSGGLPCRLDGTQSTLQCM